MKNTFKHEDNCAVVLWFVNYRGERQNPCVIAKFRTVKWAERFLEEIGKEKKEGAWEDNVFFTLEKGKEFLR